MSCGGYYKQSDSGRAFSLEGMLDSFTQRKSVTVNLAVRDQGGRWRQRRWA